MCGHEGYITLKEGRWTYIRRSSSGEEEVILTKDSTELFSEFEARVARHPKGEEDS